MQIESKEISPTQRQNEMADKVCEERAGHAVVLGVTYDLYREGVLANNIAALFALGEAHADAKARLDQHQQDCLKCKESIGCDIGSGLFASQRFHIRGFEAVSQHFQM